MMGAVKYKPREMLAWEKRAHPITPDSDMFKIVAPNNVVEETGVRLILFQNGVNVGHASVIREGYGGYFPAIMYYANGVKVAGFILGCAQADLLAALDFAYGFLIAIEVNGTDKTPEDIASELIHQTAEFLGHSHRVGEC